MSGLTTTFPALDRAERLNVVRAGTQYAATYLSALTDNDFDAPSLLDGWSRRHVLAHLGYNATALCRLLQWAQTGVETPMYDSPEQRAQEIADGAGRTLYTLRSMYRDRSAELEQRWRDLSPTGWDTQVRTAQGRIVPASETVWLRSREVWIHAVDLDNGASFSDFPAAVLVTLLVDVVAAWQRRGVATNFVIEAQGSPPHYLDAGPGDAILVRGDLADVVRWATGRPADRRSLDVSFPPAPRWL